MTVHARVCGALCGEARAGSDFSGMECAVAVRVRLLAPFDPAQAPLLERCVALAAGGDAQAYRLGDLFDTGAGGARPLDLGADPGVPFVVEVALYAPGSRPCADDQPLVGLGRSGVVDLRQGGAPGDIEVPLGCRRACDQHGNAQAQLLALEDTVTALPLPDDLALGEVFPYRLLTSTAGVCAPPPLPAHRGSYREFDIARAGWLLDGSWVTDRSGFAGCTVLAATLAGGRQLACLADDATSRSVLTGYALGGAHLAAVSAFNASLHATSGALVVRVLDPADQDPAGSAVGARVTYSLMSSLNEADYPADDAWSLPTAGGRGTTAAGLGCAVVADAPTGPYLIRFSDGTTRTVNLGGADDPASVTVALVGR